MQVRREVGGLAERQGFLPDACPDRPDHHEPGMDPQPHSDPVPWGQRQPGVERVQGVQHAQPRPDGPLGIVFMRQGIAKIDHEATLEVLGQIAVIPVNHRGTALLVGPHHLAQVFWVQVPRQRRRIDQLAAQHRELAAFRLQWWQGLGG